ncbi:MAG: polysaccharide biosynthesis/export family protein [Betaproteobacteria bacterium]|nr:polysaccharide biosynthesis/export family protein [Betaproteobacteria bacterium]
MKNSLRMSLLFALLLPLFVSHPASAFPAAPSGTAPKVRAPAGYLLAPGDVLDISVWGEKDLPQEVVVRPDGGISYPLAGDMRAAGKSVAQLETEITRRLKKYIPAAVVTVMVDKVEGNSIYVIGQVNKPGEFVTGGYVTVLQALSMAGGLTPYAADNDIKVIRQDGRQSRVFSFHYADMEKGNDLAQDIQLEPGDVVVVP